jgi:CRISPR-associated protein Csb2
METISIEFPAGRYHATPWDAHVNEGRVEWPPSPWRLLRALLAVGYTKLGWGEYPDPVASDLIEKLSAVSPTYTLPAATAAHTRHYMPIKDGTSKVFDAFLRFTDPDARLLIHYDVVLSDDERQVLGKLVAGLTYLGRAESWAVAELLAPDSDREPTSGGYCCVPWRGSSEEIGDACNRIRLLRALPSDDFAAWRATQIDVTAESIGAEEAAKQSAKGKPVTAAMLKKVRQKAEALYPNQLLDALQAETSTWQSQGWPQPPGSQWVDYRIPIDVIEQKPLNPIPANPPQSRVHAVLLAIDGDGKSGTVRPLMKRALPLMELVHSEAVRKSTDALGFGNISELSGKDNDNAVLRGHRHASWIPLSLFGHGRIDHILVHCVQGFSSQAIASLASVRWAYSKDIARLSINLAGMGDLDEILKQLRRNPLCRSADSLSLDSAKIWESATPLVLRKYLQKHGKKTPEGQLREELIERGFDEPKSIRFWSAEEMVRRRLKGYVLVRKLTKRQPPMERSFAATIEFDRPQSGPILLGYASHFGLGLFKGVDTKTDSME